MKSVFNEADYTAILQRIQTITGQEKAIWGKMTVGQMLAHVTIPIQVAMEEKSVKKGYWVYY